MLGLTSWLFLLLLCHFRENKSWAVLQGRLNVVYVDVCSICYWWRSGNSLSFWNTEETSVGTKLESWSLWQRCRLERNTYMDTHGGANISNMKCKLHQLGVQSEDREHMKTTSGCVFFKGQSTVKAPLMKNKSVMWFVHLKLIGVFTLLNDTSYFVQHNV